MRSIDRAAAAALLLLVLCPSAALAQKSLHWRSLDVSARLDANGTLHVVERHAMVFTGDWNGGERVFRLLSGQRLAFEGIKRVDPATGLARDLASGDLSAVDHYAFTNPTTLRWRSRLPSDPPFDSSELDYQIAYALSGILVRHGDVYTLDHNFALPDASQTIEAFSVDLELDPAWAAPADFVRRRTAGPLSPGSDVVVRADLRYVGAGEPASVQTGTSPAARLALFGVLLAAIGLIVTVFVRRESALARFAPIAPAGSVDAAWLDQHVFNLKPEEAGALWDDTVGSPEVAAVLARLTAEKRIQSWTKDGELSMRLKHPLSSFDGYEHALLAGLFFGKHEETSTSEIKSHYASTGFDPAEKIKPKLMEALAKHPDFQDRSGRPPRWPTMVLFAAGAALLVLLVLGGTVGGDVIFASTFALAIWWPIGLVGARAYQFRVERLGAWSVTLAFVPVLFLLRAAAGINAADASPFLLLAAVCLLQIAIVNNTFNVAKTREGAKKLQRRRELVAARRYLRRELEQPQPRLKDEWFPWLVAFGLGPKVDRWFRAFGGAATASTGGSGVSSSLSHAEGSSGGGGFTGGGGMSGGGGASGSWAVAAGALASGVSAPSSSSGGGGGGGGSSGGGGGGGW